MRPIFSIILLSIGLLNVPSPGFAEVSLQHDRLTLHVQAVPLDEVLLDLSHEGAFRISILKAQDTNNTIISEQFDSLPVEEGLERLLLGWKYGLIRNPQSGEIREVFLISKQTQMTQFGESLFVPELENR